MDLPTSGYFGVLWRLCDGRCLIKSCPGLSILSPPLRSTLLQTTLALSMIIKTSHALVPSSRYLLVLLHSTLQCSSKPRYTTLVGLTNSFRVSISTAACDVAFAYCWLQVLLSIGIIHRVFKLARCAYASRKLHRARTQEWRFEVADTNSAGLQLLHKDSQGYATHSKSTYESSEHLAGRVTQCWRREEADSAVTVQPKSRGPRVVGS